MYDKREFDRTAPPCDSPRFDLVSLVEHLKACPRKQKFRLIAAHIELRIRGGTLVPGTRLPPQRDLCLTIGVSRTCVINAYAELVSKNLAECRIGDGTYVTAALYC